MQVSSLSQQELPIEIISRIFTYSSSPIAKLIQESQWYQKPFPFLYLNDTSFYSNDMKKEIKQDYRDYYREVVDRSRMNVRYSRYTMPHVYRNDGEMEYFEGDDIIFDLDPSFFRRFLPPTNLLPHFENEWQDEVGEDIEDIISDEEDDSQEEMEDIEDIISDEEDDSQDEIEEFSEDEEDDTYDADNEYEDDDIEEFLD
jgi:hypothetical protein